MVEGVVQMEQDMPSYAYFRNIARDRALLPGGAAADARLAAGGAEYADLAKKEYLMGFLEKRDFVRQRWQRRWCVLSEDKKQLFYFGHPNDRKPRAVVDLLSVFKLCGATRGIQYRCNYLKSSVLKLCAH